MTIKTERRAKGTGPTRRAVAAGLGASAFLAAAPARGGPAIIRPRTTVEYPDRPYSDNELRAIIEADAETLPVEEAAQRAANARALRNARGSAKLWASLEEPRPAAAWEAGTGSINTRHLLSVEDPCTESCERFEFTHEHMMRLCQWNGFPFASEASRDKRILFGLRGCRLTQEPDLGDVTFGPALELEVSSPDHRFFHCVMGVWDPGAGLLWAANASTVPTVEHVFKQLQYAPVNDRYANMMPTGLFHFTVGLHGRSAGILAQPGAFIQADKRLILRSVSDLTYTGRDWWDGPRNVADNIHAASISNASNWPYRFSSAGCQTIPGGYDATRRRPRGKWADFRVAAGLKREPEFVEPESENYVKKYTTTEDGTPYKYILLTGLDALLATRSWSQSDEAGLRRWRVGSNTGGAGDEDFVAQLNIALGFPVAGSRFTTLTGQALIQWQLEADGFADCVATPEVLARLQNSL